MSDTSTLAEKVNEAMKKTDKRQVGYTVSAYAGVLSALQRAEGSSGQSVLGKNKINWEKVQALQYDNNTGFSTDTTSGMWQMALTFYGALPILDKTYGTYELLPLPSDNLDKEIANNPMLNNYPKKLDKESLDACTVENFQVGAWLDLSNYGKQYFNHFYSHGQTKDFTDEVVNSLFNNGLINIQIIFPDKKDYQLVKLQGQSQQRNSACICLNTPIFGCRGWDESGVTIQLKENGRDVKTVIPESDEYKFACQGENYDPISGTISNFNKTTFENWLQNTSENRNSREAVLNLVQPETKLCFVRLYIPESKKAEAQVYLADINPNDFIYQEYFVPVFSGVQAVEYTGQALTLIAEAAKKWGGVQSAGKVSNGAAVGNTGKVAYSTNGRPHILTRGNPSGINYNSTSGEIKPIFGHDSNIFDCSSYVCNILWNSGIVKDDVQTIEVFSTGELTNPNIVNSINKYLKPQYKAVFMQITDNSQVQQGDILVINVIDRIKRYGGNFNYGHAAMAFPENGKLKTIEHGGRKGLTMVENNRGNRYYTYYTHLIRIVDKQQEQ